MGAKATKSPSNSEVSGKPHSLLRRIREDDGPEGPHPLGLLGLVGRYKASTHQTHSRVVTTQLVFKTSVYVLCAPTDCKPPPPEIQGAQAVNIGNKEQTRPLLLP